MNIVKINKSNFSNIKPAKILSKNIIILFVLSRFKNLFVKIDNKIRLNTSITAFKTPRKKQVLNLFLIYYPSYNLL